MRTTRGARGRARIRLLTAPLGPLTLLVFLAAVILAVAVVFRAAPTPSRVEARRAVAGRPVASAVVHIQATRSEPGAGARANTVLEAWLDEATNEGKVVEAAPDGTVRRVESFADGTYTLYLADARHAVIRRGIGPNSPHATRIRTQLYLYRMATERGQARVIGNGRVGERATDRIQFEAGGMPIVADVDRVTGLALREELGPLDGARHVRETSYSKVAHISRASLPAKAFAVDLPPGTGREEYTERQGDSIRTDPIDGAYAVYALPARAGAPVAAFRRASAAPDGGPANDVYYLVYQTAGGEIQVVSSLPPDAAVRQGKGPLPTSRPQMVQIASVTWEAEPSGRGFQGSAYLGDAYVTIFAPDRATFERTAASLERLDP